MKDAEELTEKQLRRRVTHYGHVLTKLDDGSY